MTDFNYLDELVLYEHGKYDINQYKEWVTGWENWLNDPSREETNDEHIVTDKIISGSEVLGCLDEFKNKSDIIIVNRYDEELNDVKQKVFCRDVYGEN